MRDVLALAAIFDWRSRAVLLRNFASFRANWRTALVPPAAEPIIFFLVFGLGLQSYVGQMPYHGKTVAYAAYVAPGMLAYSAFTTPFYESLYSAYVRMFYQKTWDGILATQVEIPHLVWGEVLWAGLRGAIATTIVSCVLAMFTLLGYIELQLQWLPLMPVIAFFVGLGFSSFALIFTATVPGIDHMNYPVFLVGMPLSLISNTYFPLHSEYPILRILAECNPIFHLAEVVRGLLLMGTPGRHVGMLMLTSGVAFVVFGVAAQRLTRFRVVRGGRDG